MAFEPGEKNWKLGLGDGVRAPSRYSVGAGDTCGVSHAPDRSTASLRAVVVRLATLFDRSRRSPPFPTLRHRGSGGIGARVLRKACAWLCET